MTAGRSTADFLVIGGGVIGLQVALELRGRHPEASVRVLEKEPDVGRHASGRNSGVLHAGFYYSPDSLKARLCRDGNRWLTEYCETRGLPIRRCGKLVVARSANDLPGLDLLFERGRQNGVALEMVDPRAAREIEPRARTVERALYSPSTSSVDPRAVIASLALDAERAGIELCRGTAYRGRVAGGDAVLTSSGPVSAGCVVNAAGLYADGIAREFGFSGNHRILPFKGLYLEKVDEKDRGGEGPALHIYPVPDLDYPFLGVHFTVSAHGRVMVGPTAIPAFWREQYGLLSNFAAGELREVMGLQAKLFLENAFGFRKVARREIVKYLPRVLLARAATLVEGELDPARWRRGRPGIRAQLVNLAERRLEMDFLVEGDERSFHVLNAVSPAFTCSRPFAVYLADRIDALTSGRDSPTVDTASARRASARNRAAGSATPRPMPQEEADHVST